MDNSQACQLFKYDHEFFLVTRNTPEYFASEFVETAYRRFIERRLREEFGFPGTPVEVVVKVKERE